MHRIKNGLMLIVGVGAVLTFTLFFLPHALDRQAIADCGKWEAYSEEYPNFYLTKGQDEQCRYFGIIINAPVR